MGGRERGKDGMPHERENTRRDKLSFFYFLLCGNCVPHLETLHTGNYCQARLSRQPAHSDGLHVHPPPPFPPPPANIQRVYVCTTEFINSVVHTYTR